MTAELALRRPPVVTFSGGPHRFEADMVGAPRAAVAYRVPANTCDPRYRACTDHHVACDCREAELAEDIGELRAEFNLIRDAARRALANHQLHQLHQPHGLRRWERGAVPLCLCSGCVIARETSALLGWDAVDFETGRVR